MSEGKKIVAEAACENQAGPRPLNPVRAPWWSWPHLLSLDAPAVAVGWQVWWAHENGTQLAWAQHAILGLSVWMIYLADRLADGLRVAPVQWGAFLHEFSGRHKVVLGALLAAALGTLTLLEPRLSGKEFPGGVILMAAAAIYFWMIHGPRGWVSRKVPKEAVVGAMFTVGTRYFLALRVGPSWLFATRVALFGVLCFVNCALITRWQRTLHNRRDRFSLLNIHARGIEYLGVASTLLAASS